MRYDIWLVVEGERYIQFCDVLHLFVGLIENFLWLFVLQFDKLFLILNDSSIRVRKDLIKNIILALLRLKLVSSNQLVELVLDLFVRILCRISFLNNVCIQSFITFDWWGVLELTL